MERDEYEQNKSQKGTDGTCSRDVFEEDKGRRHCKRNKIVFEYCEGVYLRTGIEKAGLEYVKEKDYRDVQLRGQL